MFFYFYSFFLFIFFEWSIREDAPRIVAELVAAGESVYRVEVRHSSLEDVYLDAVGGQTG